MNNLFFELIRVAIGTQERLTRPPLEKEWQQLYDMSKKQSLVGICFAGLRRLYNSANQEPSTQNPQPNSTQNQALELCSLRSAGAEDPITQNLDEVLYLRWMGMAAKIQQRNEVVNRQCVELQAKLSADGFRSYIMKGQSVASLYGEHLSGLRQTGDIDVYIEGGLDKVLAYARTFGETTKVNRLEMSVPIYQDTEVEFHYKPFYMPSPWDDRRLQRFFDSCTEANFNNKVSLVDFEMTAPTTEFNMVHQMVHIWHHFMTEGVGLRQLMDYYFVLRTSYDNDDDNDNRNDNVLRIISDLGLERFAAGVMNIMRTVFGMEEEHLLWTPDPEAGAWILSEVMQKGNFGHLSDDNLMKRAPLERLWIKTKFAIKYRDFGHAAWFWIPVRSMADRVWQWRHGFKM